MSKKVMQFVSAFVCITILITPAFSSTIRASAHINVCSASLSKKGNGDLCLTLTVIANGVMDTVGASSVIVQRNTQSGWIQESIFTAYNTPELQGNGTSQHIVTIVYTPDYESANYRAVVNIYAKNQTGSDSRQIITNIV